MSNSAKEFVTALLYPEQPFSPKHLSHFAVEVLEDPSLKIKDLSIMIAHILPLIADRAQWPGQREIIRRRFANALGRIPVIKYNYWIKQMREEKLESVFQAHQCGEKLIQECRKVNDEEFVRDAVRQIRRNLRKITILPKKLRPKS